MAILLQIIGLNCLPFFPLKSLFNRHANLPVDPPIMGDPISLCDGEVIGGKICIYKCKLCDMPRMFVMKYGTNVG